MRKSNITVLFACIACTLGSYVNAQLPGDWPPLDAIPPSKPEWNDLVDLSEVTDAPIAADDLANCNNDLWCTWPCKGCVASTDIVTCPGNKDWGLTFDDGPSENTVRLLDELDILGTKVTFFVVGSQVVRFPDILKRAATSGHEIGIHTWSHPHLIQLTTEQVIAEFKWTELAIKTVIGVTPKSVRPPFGSYDDRIRDIAAQLGYKIILWDLDTQDFLQKNNPSFDPTDLSDLFVDWVELNTTNGHISLNHDLYLPGVVSTPASVLNIQAGGFTLKPASVCNGLNPYFESNQTLVGDIPNSTVTYTTTYNSATSTTSATATSPATTTSSDGSGLPTTITPAATNFSQAESSAVMQIYPSCFQLVLLIMLTVYSARIVL